jgi:hypothetical protein
LVNYVCAILTAVSDWPIHKQDVVDHNTEKGGEKMEREREEVIGRGRGGEGEVASRTFTSLSGNCVFRGSICRCKFYFKNGKFDAIICCLFKELTEKH